jgi:hypothetical protein
VIRTIFKFLLPTIVTLFFLLFYLLYTDSGQKNTYGLLSYYATKKAGLDVEVKTINLHQYPYVQAELLVEELYHIDIDGFVKNKKLDLRYKLNSHCLKSNICSFDDIIDIQGQISGWRKNFSITGHGKALEGEVKYAFKKIKHAFRDIKLQLTDVNSTKLLTMLNQKALFHGRANAILDFDIIEKKHRVGTLVYDVQDTNFHDLDTHFHAVVQVKDNTHTFVMDLNTSDAFVHVDNGTYDLNTRYAQANYSIEIKDLSKLKKLLGATYLGAFHAKGELEYKNKQIYIKGLSHDLGGDLYFVYDSKVIELILKNISFEKLMQRLDTKPILQANITGFGTYNLEKKEMKLETKLKQTKLLPSNITHTLQKKFNFNIEKEIFDQSSFALHYKDKHVVSSNFILANNNAYIKLKDTKINASHNAIRTYIDLKTPKHTLLGKLFARIDNIGEKSLDDIYINYDGTIEKYYHIKVDGLLSDTFMNMDYTLTAARLPSNVCTIVDDINLSGHASGSFDRLHIVADGTAMEGRMHINAIKMKEHLENVSLTLHDIHTLKFFTLLGLPDFPSGKADIDADFTYLSETNKQGILHYQLKNGYYHSLPLTIDAEAKVKEKEVSFIANAKLSTADINITKGLYRFDTNTSKAFYTLYTKNLIPLEPLIGSYAGAFSTTGELNYNKALQIRGLSPSLGGMVDFLYQKDMLYIDLENASLRKLMHLLDYPPMLDATIKGSINYNYQKEKLLVDTKLLNTTFLDSDIVQTVLNKSGVNMLKETFPQSTLRANYQNKVLIGDLMLKSEQSHFYLTSVRIDKKNNSVNGFFDLKMQGQAFSGKVTGDLKHPKVDLDMQKLLRYQMDKQLDATIGKGNRKLMEAMPMGDVAKDMASEMGGGFLDMFF